MSRILLADDSPHAQRMGERILREEGFEVVTVTDGETALIRLPDVDPDLVMVDVLLPNKSGYEVCEHIKNNPKFRHTRVVLLAGLLEPMDDAQAQRVKADAVLKKPFEASAVMATVKPLVAAARADRPDGAGAGPVRRQTGSILGLSLPPQRPLRTQEPPKPEPAAAAAAAPAPDRRAASSTETPAIDPERVRAAVTVALDRAMPAMIDAITERVLVALGR